MPDTKISELPAAGALAGTDALPVVQGGATKKATVAQVLAGAQPADANLAAIAALDPSTVGVLATDGAGWIRKSYAAIKAALGLTKGDVGLGNVDNTSDVNKPVSTAQAAALAIEATARGAADSALDGRLDSVEATLPTKADLVGGLIPTAQIPSIAISTFLGDVASEAAMLALDGELGDWANRTDIPGWAVISGPDPSDSDDWQVYAFGASGSGVTSVDGDAGPVVVLPGDGAAGTATKRTLGPGATQAAPGNDPRLSDARTPTVHAVSHQDGGTDELALAQAQVTGLPAALAAKVSEAEHLDFEHLRIRDEFDRADVVGSLGPTTTHGRAWGGEGAWSITNQRAHKTGGGYAIVSLEPHHAFGLWSVELGPGCDLAEWWLIFRLVDGNNYFRVGRGAANTYDVQRIVSGSIGAADVMLSRNTPHKVPEPGDVVTVALLPDDGIDVYVNGILYWTGAEADDHWERTVGLAAASATPTFERVEFLPVGGGDATMLALALAGGATDLDDLTDVAITAPAAGHILRHNGAGFVNSLHVLVKTVAEMAAFPAGTAPGQWYFVTNDNGGAFWYDDGTTIRKTLGLSAVPAGATTTVRKTAETARASTIVVADDPHLIVPIGANETLRIDGLLLVYGAEAGDFQWLFTAPAGAAGVYHAVGMDLAATGGALVGTVRSGAQTLASGNTLKSGVSTLANTPGGLGIPIRALIRNGATAGFVTLQWAQNTSNATATALMVDSFLDWRKV